MNISNSQVDRLRHFVRAGLRALFRPEPQTAVEWADANYYLPKESAYQEGRWETLPFQRAIMNAMGSDYIREVNVVKSARVGYSKMLLGVYGDTAIVVYSGQYVENDVKKNFLPDNTMVLGNTQARGLRTYGCIQDADAQREGINASARYPKNWVTTGDPAREFTMIQSAPLMLLADPDAFVSVQLA
ncbi:major capsid protein [Escherichia coli]|uniref:major capsid protein n=1 Tax=Escherichia coli TaxID=562 RepID=UPI003F8D854D